MWPGPIPYPNSLAGLTPYPIGKHRPGPGTSRFFSQRNPIDFEVKYLPSSSIWDHLGVSENSVPLRTQWFC